MHAIKAQKPNQILKIRRLTRGLTGGLFAVFTLIFLFLFLVHPQHEIHLFGYEWSTSASIIRILQAILGIFLAQTVVFTERFLPLRIPLLFEILLDVFLVLALFLGSIFDLFSIFRHFNTVVHFYWSVLISIFSYGLWHSHHLPSHPNASAMPLTTVDKTFGSFFALGMASMTSLIWEWVEFTVDTIIPAKNSQRTLSAEGTPLPGRAAIWDTMTDMAAHLIGGLCGIVLFQLLDRLGEKRSFDWQLKPQVLQK